MPNRHGCFGAISQLSDLIDKDGLGPTKYGLDFEASCASCRSITTVDHGINDTSTLAHSETRPRLEPPSAPIVSTSSNLCRRLQPEFGVCVGRVGFAFRPKVLQLSNRSVKRVVMDKCGHIRPHPRPPRDAPSALAQMQKCETSIRRHGVER